MLLLSPNLSAILFCYGFATFLSINLISTFCTQFHLFALNFNFLHCLGLIDVLSPNQHAEIFACILLPKKLLDITSSLPALSDVCDVSEVDWGPKDSI